ncbi:YeeE/YedE thiosulfate transporter family protein [Sulfuriflexus mobilis]|uniref:YeeE/YedE thiosulfate transporter family protein n=1 Tax=Sulfuriflexus mobilis TaxID=1811807 RepID=UPI0018D502CB|nr:YeeE/YedE thiosulfate transporter family protein [Sulfuriflexus mobilis]
MNEDTSFLKRYSRVQWSFFWAGITFGVAQVIYMIGLWVEKAQAGKTATLTPITVTTDLGKMFRSMEVTFYRIFDLPDFQLYGKAIDGVAAAGGAFIPGIGWPIVGMILGGWLVTRMEKESRAWVYYPPKVLLISFIGGMLFSYGTRLAGGCTLNHLMGGIPLMNIHSFVTVFFMAIGGAVGFYVLGRAGMASYFKHQETRSYVCGNDAGEAATCPQGKSGTSNPLYWVGFIFAVLFVGIAVYGGIYNPESLQHLKNGELAAFGKSVADKGWYFVILTLIAGIIGGIGLAKSGMGTECALVSWEAGGMMKKHDSFYAKMGVPRITRTLMRSYLPMIGLMAHWVVMLGFVVFAWILFDVAPGFSGALKFQTTAGNLIGGVLLGLGAVMLIGCEIRSYMRIGMGYLNTLVGFMGFAVGYLPFTLNYAAHKEFLSASLMIETYKWYDYIFPNSIAGQKAVLALWWVVLLFGLIYMIKVGARNTGASTSSLVHRNTEDVQNEIDEKGRQEGGNIGGVNVPEPASA